MAKKQLMDITGLGDSSGMFEKQIEQASSHIEEATGQQTKTTKKYKTNTKSKLLEEVEGIKKRSTGKRNTISLPSDTYELLQNVANKYQTSIAKLTDTILKHSLKELEKEKDE